MVVTRADRARSLPQPPAYLLGAGEAHWNKTISQMPDLTVTAAIDSSKRAFEMARVSPRDVNVVELYDAFTINTILFLEDMGFCSKGEGGEFVADGRIAPGGVLPVNTNGGVRLIRQRSDADCVYARTWGYDRNGIWVDRGCRADFEVGRLR